MTKVCFPPWVTKYFLIHNICPAAMDGRLYINLNLEAVLCPWPLVSISMCAPSPPPPQTPGVPPGHGDPAPHHLGGQVSVAEVNAVAHGVFLSHGFALRGLRFPSTCESKTKAPANLLQGLKRLCLGPAWQGLQRILPACVLRGFPHSPPLFHSPPYPS